MTHTPRPHRPPVWRVIRRFDGARDPEAVLRALIRAHSR